MLIKITVNKFFKLKMSGWLLSMAQFIFFYRKLRYISLHFAPGTCSISLRKSQTKFEDFINFSKP